MAALERGEASVSDLSRHSGIHRVACYPLIDELVQKKLLKQTEGTSGKIISAAHPRQLKAILQKQQRELRKMELKYEDVLPELTALFKGAVVRPRVQFYEGISGLEAINADIVDTMKEINVRKRTIQSYANPNVVHERFTDYVYQEGGIIDLRKEHSIFNRVIAVDGPITQDITQRDKEELRETIVLSEKQFPFRNDITLYGNKMAIMALRTELIGVVIESAEIIQDQCALFELAWLGAQQLSS